MSDKKENFNVEVHTDDGEQVELRLNGWRVAYRVDVFNGAPFFTLRRASNMACTCEEGDKSTKVISRLMRRPTEPGYYLYAPHGSSRTPYLVKVYRSEAQLLFRFNDEKDRNDCLRCVSVTKPHHWSERISLSKVVEAQECTPRSVLEAELPSAIETVHVALHSRGMFDKFTVNIKKLPSERTAGRYRLTSQFVSRPTFEISENIVSAVHFVEPSTESRKETVQRYLQDTLFHEYGHVIWEFAHWCDLWPHKQIKVLRAFIDSKYGTEEEDDFAEDFMLDMQKRSLQNVDFFKEVVKQYADFAFAKVLR